MEDEIMESRTSLFDRFASLHNFRAAFRRVAVKNSRGGIDQKSTDDFAEKRDRNLGLLLDTVISGDYTPEPVAAIHIPKFNDAGEWRELGLPTIADKVVQTALLQVKEVSMTYQQRQHNHHQGFNPGKRVNHREPMHPRFKHLDVRCMEHPVPRKWCSSGLERPPRDIRLPFMPAPSAITGKRMDRIPEPENPA
jgi:hypothetical protein